MGRVKRESTSETDMPAGLSEEDIAREQAFLAGVPLINWGAFFMPPIWGAGHGEVLPALFYPAWVFVDELIYSAVTQGGTMTWIFAVISLVAILLVSVAYARVSSPKSAHRAAEKGKTREQYLRAERKWAIGMFLLAAAFVVFATWFNLNIRPTL